MTPRVRLCAIAKNEGAYIPDWVFHHLYFGFDAIEIWVNGTTDPTMRILRRIQARYPQVTFRKVDRMLERCIANGEHFQEHAYNRLASKAKRDGFTHAAFLDLDEYWTPRDGRSQVKAFIPPDPDVNVVSFNWWLDVPDQAKQPFAAPLADAQHLQMDRHVKSVIHLDGSVRRVRAHTARVRGGRQLLVRDPFPLVDRKAQKSGSFVTHHYFYDHWSAFPEAFVLHAKSRSETEYLASLSQGMKQNQETGEFKLNRSGYVKTKAPVLTFTPGRRSISRYTRHRQSFLKKVGARAAIARAEAMALERAETLIQRALHEPETFEQLKKALPGVVEPRLDETYPAWRVETDPEART